MVPVLGLRETRAVLDGVAAELRRIIAGPEPVQQVDAELRLAA